MRNMKLEPQLAKLSIDAAIDEILKIEYVYPLYYKKGRCFITQSLPFGYTIQIQSHKSGVLLFWISKDFYFLLKQVYSEEFTMNAGTLPGFASIVYTGAEFKKRLLALKRSTLIDDILESL